MLVSCSKAEDKQQTVVEEDILVQTDLAHLESVDQTQQYTANVEAFNANNISPATPNRIKTITVDVGDKVRAGQVLATMDNSSAAQLKVALDQVERDYNRAVKLLEIGSGTQATVDQLKAQLDAQRTQYRNVMDNTVLTAPVSGIVTARNYDPGDVTGQMPILTVGQITPSVKLVISITEQDRSAVTQGEEVTILFDALPDQPRTGRISRIYPAVDPATRTFQAEVQVDNRDMQLFPGMFARVTLNHGAKEHVVVPDRAVVKQAGSGNKYVYVYKNGKVSYNKVELGRRLDAAYEVISGVADGDTVVISGQTRLADGVPVKIQNNKKQ